MKEIGIIKDEEMEKLKKNGNEGILREGEIIKEE